jgi:hypothetical protein
MVGSYKEKRAEQKHKIAGDREKRRDDIHV